VHVVVNAATSADGKLASRRRDQVAISGPEDFARVDRLRADSDAVLVGVGTVLADDPGLTVDDPDLREQRQERGEPANPARIVADSRARTPTDARILDGAAQTYVLVADAAADRKRGLEAAGAEVIVAGGGAGSDGDDRVALAAGLAALEDRGIDQLLVEGGGELLFSLFADGLVDELSQFVGPTVIGGREAPTLVDGEGFVEAPDGGGAAADGADATGGDGDTADDGGFVDLALDGVEELDGGVLLRWTVAAADTSS